MHMTNMDVIASVAIFTLLIMVPLGLTGQNVLKSINHVTTAQSQVGEWLGEDSGLRLLRVKVRGHVVDVRLSGSGTVPDIGTLERVLSERLGVEAEVQVELFPTVVLKSSGQRVVPEDDALPSAHGVDDSGGETGRKGDEDGALE